MATAFHKVVEEINQLNLEEKEQVKEITEKMIIEDRRKDIKKNVEISRKEFAEGKTKSFNNVDDLINSLTDED